VSNKDVYRSVTNSIYQYSQFLIELDCLGQ